MMSARLIYNAQIDEALLRSISLESLNIPECTNNRANWRNASYLSSKSPLIGRMRLIFEA